MTPSALATQIVNDYISSYSSSLGITQSAANLGLVDELATAVNSFAQAMLSASGDWSKIQTARGQAQEYYYVYYIDLYHFAQLVNQNASISQPVRDAASSVMTAVNNAIIAEGHTPSLANSHGLSIYYPETLGDYFSDYKTSVLFTTDTQWDEFLEAIFSPDTTPPTIASTSPAASATGVAVTTTVTATFSETMAASTITTTSFTLKAGATPVSGSVSYNSDTYTATFTPSANLAIGTTYTATLSTTITDAAGNPLASAYSWNFTTASAVTPGDANGDGNVNALDITKVERIIAGLDTQTSGADANQDGNVNALDITKIERISAGLN
jgi:hypothetical protein